MARICPLTCTVFQHGPVKRPISSRPGHIAASKTPSIHIASSAYKKLFEDQSRGIICYRDDSGEMVCEGYDEGPRFHPQLPNKTSRHLRNLGIVHLLEQNWFQIAAQGDGFHVAE